MLEALRSVLSNPWFLVLWGSSTALALAFVSWDLAKNNREMMSLMKVVWVLTVIYSGLVGLLIYYYSGRQQIRTDNIWRKSFRSVAHCYSGCGLGEILGLLLTVALLALAQAWVVAVTFTLAYLFGLGLTIGPLLQDGMPFSKALKDAVLSESLSIIVMEAVAISVDLFIAGDAGITQVLFWSSLIVSLTLGLCAAYPVNVLLIQRGVKAGMHDPRHMAHAH